jgi:hypothetical protein
MVEMRKNQEEFEQRLDLETSKFEARRMSDFNREVNKLRSNYLLPTHTPDDIFQT